MLNHSINHPQPPPVQGTVDATIATMIWRYQNKTVNENLFQIRTFLIFEFNPTQFLEIEKVLIFFLIER